MAEDTEVILLSDRDAITELTLAHQIYATNGQPGTADGRAALSVLKTLLDTIYEALGHVHAINGVTGLQAALTALGVDITAVEDALAAHGHSFASLSSKPTTLAGYGISDAATSAALALIQSYLDDAVGTGELVRESAAGSGSAIPNFYIATDYLAGDGVTDDTVAFQALLVLVADAGGGIIYFPKGIYLIGGALQDTGVGGSNAQIIIPLRDRSVPTVAIDLIGATTPPMTLSTQPAPSGATHAVIKSTLTGASGTASMIGGKAGEEGALNNVTLNLSKLVFRCPANPTLTAVDLSNQTGGYVEKVLIDDGVVTETHNEPTTGTSYGIKLPPASHASAVYVNGLAVIGYFNGIRLGELTEGSMRVSACHAGIIAPFAYHPSTIKVGIYGCPYGIYVESSFADRADLNIEMLDIQHNDGGLGGQVWQESIADIFDPSSEQGGYANWTVVTAAVGNTHNLRKTGGEYFHCAEKGYRGILTDAATIQTNAAQGTAHSVTIEDDRILGFPTNLTHNQVHVYEIIQPAGGGGKQITLASGFVLGSDIPAIVLSSGANKRDFLTAKYNAVNNQLYVVAFVKDY